MQSCVTCAATMMIGLASAASAWAGDKFSLAGALPDDVFIATVARHNPEREFLEKYWNEVWEAFEKSGVIEDTLPDVFGGGRPSRRQRFRTVYVTHLPDPPALDDLMMIAPSTSAESSRRDMT